MSARPSRVLAAAARHLFLAALVVVVGFPLYWMVDTALTDPGTFYVRPQDLLPSFGSFGAVWRGATELPLVTILTNSGVVATGAAAVSVLLGLNAAYALSRLRYRGRGVVSMVLFATQMVPEGAFLVPIYAIFLALGLTNSLTGLVLVNAAFTLPVSILIIKAGLDTVPAEIDEAARVDGCPRFGVLYSVLVPLIWPSLGSAAVLAFFAGWSELMFASTFITDQAKWPASVQLAALVSSPVANLPVIMAVSVVYSLPAIVFFLLIQRRIVSGLTAGAVKG